MSRNAAFDRFRGIGALCVVLLHAPPLYHSGVEPLRALGWLLRAACQCAVPFFFLLSGWMLATRWASGRTSPRDLLEGLGRLAKLYVPWFALYLALDLAAGLPSGWIEVARRFAGFSEAALDTRGYHLWFLPSLMMAQVATWASLRWTGSVLPALAVGAALYAGAGILEILGLPFPLGLAPHEGLNISLVCVAAGAALVRSRLPSAGTWGMAAWIALPVLWLETFALGAFAGDPWAIAAFPILRILLPALLVLALHRSPDLLGRGLAGRFLDLAARNATLIYVAHLAILVLVPFDALVPNGFLRDNLVRWSVAFLLPILLGEILRRSRNPFLLAISR